MRAPCRVVILGRPNVGKSTLFNRLIGKRKALVHDFPGVTRDRMEESAEWWVKGTRFPVRMTDTGGIGGDCFQAEIKDQVNQALQEADMVLFVFDSQSGVTQEDQLLLLELNKAGIFKRVPVIAVVNKVDAEVHEQRAAEFYELGLEPLVSLSAAHGRGLDELQEAVAEIYFARTGISSEMLAIEKQEEEDEAFAAEFEEEKEPEYVPRMPRIAVVGRPNVGKSTLVNALSGERRVITSPIAGTTVDPIDTVIELNGKSMLLVDTAGIRRKSKTEQGVEVLSVVQTKKTLERSDLAFLVLDGETGISDQDEKIAGMIEEQGCSFIIAINKWDTQSKNPAFTTELAAERIRKQIPFLSYAPIVFISALHNKGLENLGDLIEDILSQRKVKIPTREFTEWVRQKATVHNPKNAKFFLCHQTGRNPPTFVCHVSDADKVHYSLSRHLVNAIRERWGYMGTPIRLLVKSREHRHIR